MLVSFSQRFPRFKQVEERVSATSQRTPGSTDKALCYESVIGPRGMFRQHGEWEYPT